MPLRIYLFTLGFCIVVFYSCRKDERTPPVDHSFLLHKWKVLSIAEQSTLENARGNYFMEFVADGTYGLALDTTVDLNACFGEYNIPQKQNIFFKYIGCTKVCCDSDYAKKLVSVIGNLSGKTASYAGKGDSLIISGIGNGKLILLKTN